jgi:hypothetical protein
METKVERKRTRVVLASAFGVAALALTLMATLLTSSAAAATNAVPVNRCAPTITGRLVVGRTINSTTGCWTNNPTKFSYQWLRCDQDGNNCAKIAGATDSSYTLTSTDAGNRMMVFVTATNGDGSTGPVNSKPSAIVSTASAPQNTTAPSITGKAVVGQLLLADPGKYSGGIPTRFTYQWQRCNASGANCVNIADETKQTYTVRAADVGFTLRVVVRASNDFGFDTSTSDRTAVVAEAQSQVVVSTSMIASTSTVTCCATTKLSGTVSTGKGGETITILALEFGQLAAVPVGSTTTSSDGSWSFAVRPSIQTTYRAKTSTSTGPPLTINVHPRVGLGFQNHTFSTKVTGGAGATSFAGKIVYYQRRNSSGRWVTLQKVVLDSFSMARFTAPLPRGVSFVRVYLPQAQAGPGYLDGVSHIKRFSKR